MVPERQLDPDRLTYSVNSETDRVTMTLKQIMDESGLSERTVRADLEAWFNPPEGKDTNGRFVYHRSKFNSWRKNRKARKARPVVPVEEHSTISSADQSSMEKAALYQEVRWKALSAFEDCDGVFGPVEIGYFDANGSFELTKGHESWFVNSIRLNDPPIKGDPYIVEAKVRG